MSKNLPVKQARFVEEYLVDINATQAAIRAGYSAKTATAAASRMLTKVNVQIAITAAMAKRSERTEVTQDMVVQELARLGFSNMADYVEWGPEGVRIKDLDELPHGVSRAVSEITVNVNEGKRTLKFKLHDKKGALESLLSHFRSIAARPGTDYVPTIGFDINEMLGDPEVADLVTRLDTRLKLLSGGEGIFLEA